MPNEIFYFKDSEIPDEVGNIPAEIFLPIRNGLKSELKVEIEYENAANHQKRKILPEVLFRVSADWYVAAYCFLRDEPRTFRLDRIVSASLTDLKETTYGIAQDIRENGIPWNREPPRLPNASQEQENAAVSWQTLKLDPGKNGPEIRIRGNWDSKVHLKTVRDFSFDLVHDAEHGDFERVKEDLVAGADINFISGDGNTPFSAAVSSGDLNVIRYLVEHGADPHAQTLDGGTALSFAARRCKMDVIRYLVEDLKMDVNAASCQGWSLLYWAVNDNRRELAEYLLTHRADIHNVTRDRETLLMTAVNSMSVSDGQAVELAQILLQHGADIHAQDKQGRTALYYALGKERLNSALFLLAAGDSVTHSDKKGVSPLLFAFQHFDEMTWRIPEPYRHKPERFELLERTVRALVGHGANVHAPDRQGVTPVMLAHGANLRYLLENGACARSFDRNGKTAAMYHALQFDELALLKEYGADLTARDFDGNGILMTVPVEYDTIRELVTRFGLPLNGKNNQGDTILHRAAREDDSDKAIVKFLIRHGADPFVKNNNGEAPADNLSLTYIYRRYRKFFRHVARMVEQLAPVVEGDDRYLNEHVPMENDIDYEN